MKTNWLLVTGVLVLCGCASKNEERNEEIRAPLAEKPAQKVDRKLVTAQNEFGFDLLRQLDGDNKSEGNLVFSPLSVSMALSMVYNGASGSTQKAIAKTLMFDRYSQDQINRANAALLFNLQSTDPNIETRVANSLWARQGVRFEKPFLERTRKYYNAQTTSLDLSTPAAMDAINNWVSKNTSGKIAQITSTPYDAQTALVLLNAVYFKGQWQNKFDKSQTADGDFHLQNGEVARVPMMNRDGEYSYLQEKTFAVVALPYGEGSTSLYVVLPNKDVPLDAVVKTLNVKTWSTLRDEMSSSGSHEGKVSLPRFKLEYDTQLNDALSTLGMKEAFSANANFSAMTKQTPMFLAQAQHKAIIEVNEEGTEAAAVTGTTTTTANEAHDEPFQFIADRPFFAVLSDNRTGSTLFFVVVRDPR
jgi:serpin B